MGEDTAPVADSADLSDDVAADAEVSGEENASGADLTDDATDEPEADSEPAFDDKPAEGVPCPVDGCDFVAASERGLMSHSRAHPDVSWDELKNAQDHDEAVESDDEPDDEPEAEPEEEARFVFRCESKPNLRVWGPRGRIGEFTDGVLATDDPAVAHYLSDSERYPQVTQEKGE